MVFYRHAKELLLLIFEYRRKISWKYFIENMHVALNKCLPPTHTHSYVFQSMTSYFYTTRYLEILIEWYRGERIYFQYVLTTIGNNPQKHLLFTIEIPVQ